VATPYLYAPAVGTIGYGAASAVNAYPTAGTATLSYDANHNLTYDGANTLAYDVENRLIAASNAPGSSGYLYDPLGHRKQSAVGASVVSFFEDGGHEIAEFTANAANIVEYVRGPGDKVIASIAHPAGLTPAGDITYYHNDPLGSPLAVTHGGAVTNAYAYGAFGETSPLAGPAFRYTGQRLDAETGLYYYRARHFSPGLGRFLQTDPAGYAGGRNLYAYVGNDPINFTDPSGMYLNQAGNAAWGLTKSGASFAYNNPLLTATVVGTIIAGGGPEDPLADAAAAAEIAAARSSLTAGEQLAANRAAGAAFEQQSLENLTQQGIQDLSRQITVRTQSGVSTRVDFLGRNPTSREIVCIESLVSGGYTRDSNDLSYIAVKHLYSDSKP
jgi:RHS repeat-associated protein